MASARAIALVQQNLPTWCATLPAVPWDTNQIATVLDANCGNVLETVRAFWVQRVSDTQPLIDTHDADATRPLSQNHANAVRMLAYWDNRIEASHKTRCGKIHKRYKHTRGPNMPLDQYGFGGPYVRTD